MIQEKFKVLVVDDTKTNIEVLEGILSSEYDVYVALNGKKAIELVPKIKPDIILLDIMMPMMDGYETLTKLNEKGLIDNVPVIFLTAKTDPKSEEQGLSLGAVDYITKPFSPSLVRLRIRNHLLCRKKIAFSTPKSNKVKHSDDFNKLCIHLGAFAEYRIHKKEAHIKRMQILIRSLLEILGKKEKYKNDLADWSEFDNFIMASSLHDIGMLAIHAPILTKASELDPKEREEMQKHTILGHDVLNAAKKDSQNSSVLSFAVNIAKSHHEHWDGSGYPEGLKAEAIPLEARLVAIADVYDALVSKRVYKEAIPHAEAVSIISKERSKQFDPEIVDAFLSIADRLPKQYEELSI